MIHFLRWHVARTHSPALSTDQLFLLLSGPLSLSVSSLSVSAHRSFELDVMLAREAGAHRRLDQDDRAHLAACQLLVQERVGARRLLPASMPPAALGAPGPPAPDPPSCSLQAKRPSLLLLPVVLGEASAQGGLDDTNGVEATGKHKNKNKRERVREHTIWTTAAQEQQPNKPNCSALVSRLLTVPVPAPPSLVRSSPSSLVSVVVPVRVLDTVDTRAARRRRSTDDESERRVAECQQRRRE